MSELASLDTGKQPFAMRLPCRVMLKSSMCLLADQKLIQLSKGQYFQAIRPSSCSLVFAKSTISPILYKPFFTISFINHN
jgi:hypothetical protein